MAHRNRSRKVRVGITPAMQKNFQEEFKKIKNNEEGIVLITSGI